MLKTLALALIDLYQRHISPRKGFGCAYRLAKGRASCSHLGLRAIRRYGVWRGLRVLDARLARCHQEAQAIARWRQPRLRAQHGVCDCGGCDLPGLECADAGSCAERVLDALSCADACGSCGDCDWRRRDEVKPKTLKELRARNVPRAPNAPLHRTASGSPENARAGANHRPTPPDPDSIKEPPP